MSHSTAQIRQEGHASDLVVGIDVSKHSLDVATDPPTRHQVFHSTPKGVAALVEHLAPMGVFLVVVEATGGYERAVVDALRDADIPVAVVNPARARDFARATGRLAKTDRIDAAVLASFGRLVRPAPGKAPSESVRRIDELMTRRRQLVDMRTMERNRQKQAVNKVAKRQIRQLVDMLDRQVDEIDRELAETIDGDPALREKADILRSVPGVGDVTARALIAELGELGEANRRQVGALAGVAPYAHESGTMKRRRATRGGRADVRTAGYMAAFSAMRCNPVIRAFAERLRAKGKPHKVVVVACIRKLFSILNAMIKSGRKWDPSSAPNPA